MYDEFPRNTSRPSGDWSTIKIGTGNNGLALGVARVGGLGAGNKITWDTSGKHDQVLIQNVAGKFDIGGFGITQPAPTPDQKLDFTVTATDGDGDTASASFSVGIDGTGINDDGLVAGVTNGPFTAARAPSAFGDQLISDKDALADLLA